MNRVAASRISYLSRPAPVSMGDDWFDVAKLDHFWVQRRFEVVRDLAGDVIEKGARLAEIGCGHGLVQRQIEDYYGKTVTGFDLNEYPLLQTVSRTSDVCCYDIFQKDPAYKGAFDVIILFDVLEHLSDENSFLDAIRFHLAPGGKLLINVPAFQYLWSTYDEAAGHIRRYDSARLAQVALTNGMKVLAWTYWGLPLTPLLVLRKLWMLFQPREKIISGGFASRGTLMNDVLLRLSRMEPKRQQLFGTSVMAVLENPA